MTAYQSPKRYVSDPTTVTVHSSTPPPLPWVPQAGFFNTVYRADTGNTFHTISAINPDFFMEDGTARTLYKNIFTFTGGTTASQLHELLEAEGGGTYNPLLGANGSLVIFNGGHYSLNGSWVVAFDFALGKWLHLKYPPYAVVDKTIDPQGSLATLSGTVVKRGFGTSPSAAWDDPDPTVARSPCDEQSASGNIQARMRVSKAGNYIQTADGVPIPGTGDINGVGITNAIPYPFHTYNGTIYLPPEGGGGSLGSILIPSHSQTGITMDERCYGIFRFDCATNTWSFFGGNGSFGSLLPLFSVKTVGLEYDSGRKLVWYLGGTAPIAFNYNLSPVKYNRVSGNSFKAIQIGPTATYMPGRNFMVYVRSNEFPAGGTPFRVPTLAGFTVNGFTFNSASTSNSFSWAEKNLIVSPAGGATYQAHMDSGTDTGWPGWKATGNPYTTSGCTDAGNIMFDHYGKPTSDTRAANDRLEYCEEEDCLLYLERTIGTDQGTAGARVNQHTLVLWKLMPPPVGQEITGTWTWKREVIYETAGCGGGAIKITYANQPSWGGKARYIPSLKCLAYIDDVTGPVQVIRSVDWT
jgi:hypothetical protein